MNVDNASLSLQCPRGIETAVLIGDIDLINEIIAAAPASLDRHTALRFGDK